MQSLAAVQQKEWERFDIASLIDHGVVVIETKKGRLVNFNVGTSDNGENWSRRYWIEQSVTDPTLFREATNALRLDTPIPRGQGGRFVKPTTYSPSIQSALSADEMMELLGLYQIIRATTNMSFAHTHGTVEFSRRQLEAMEGMARQIIDRRQPHQTRAPIVANNDH